jgi:hypothetical protein
MESLDALKRLIGMGPSEEEIAEEAQRRLQMQSHSFLGNIDYSRMKDPGDSAYMKNPANYAKEKNPTFFPDSNPSAFNQNVSQDDIVKYLESKGPAGESLAYINPMERELLMRSGASGKMTSEGIVSYAPEDPLKQAATLLNMAAPKGEEVAYINKQEAKLLKSKGGAGVPVNSSGVKSYFIQKLFGGGKDAPQLEKFDVGQSARDYVNAMSDPRLQDRMLQNRQRYDPQYQDLQMSLARRAADPMAQLAEQQAMRSQEFGSQMAERQAGSDMSLMNRFGADMTAAVRASDPLMQARVNQANELANQAYRDSQMTDLSPEMRRRATQSAREGLVSRGRGMDNVGIAAEAMSREDYLRDIIRENRDDAMKFGSYAMRGNQATSYDPLRITGGGQNFVQQGYGQRAALFGLPQESVTRINPDAGVNIGMQEYANRANYLANTYAAKEQAASGAAQGFMSMLGTAAGGYLGRGK